jgi:hypothetical protein
MPDAPIYFDDPDEGVALNLNAQVGPFGATVNGALGLLTDATLLGQSPAPGGPNRGVTRLQAFKWVQEFTGTVTLRIGGTQRIQAQLPGFLATVYTTCRDLVQTATASRIEAARGRQEYATWLWGQYTDGLTGLLAFLGEKLPEESVEVENGISGRFPLTAFPDSVRLW